MRLLLLAAALAATPVRAENPDLARRIQRGIDDIYKMEFDDCEKTFQDLLRDYPGLPYAHFGLATASWARFEYEEEESNIARHDEFERRIEDAITSGQSWMKAHPDDAQGLVCFAGTYGMRSRLALMLHQWVTAYWDGTKALKLLYRAQQIDPREYDVYTGLGMWDYYADTLPGVIKVLGRLVAIRGDAKRGVERLRLAAEKGEHTATAAKLILVEVFQDRNGPFYNPAEGLRMVREIRARFPMNPLFHFVEAMYLYDAGDGKEAQAQAESFLEAIRQHKRFYHERLLPRGYIALASAYILQHEPAKADEALSQAVDILERDRGHNRWGLWALIRRGQLRDTLGRRAEAVADYKRALEHFDYWGFHDLAKQYLKQPATAGDLASMTPP